MSFSIVDWNLNPNIEWHVAISAVDASYAKVSIHLTEADAIAGTNIIAEALTVPYGSNADVLLVQVGGASETIAFFNLELNSYHLRISSVSSSDPSIVFKISSFSDLDDIDNSVYRSEDLIQRRATYELNMHTHSYKNRSIGIANHEPDLHVGDICQLTSIRGSFDTLTFLEELTIVGTKDSLINQIDTIEYTDVVHG